MDIELQLDLATMALKGKRYDEAEQLYMKIASEGNSTEAWVGMGVCKLYQLASNRTMDEVVFCFNRAKKMSPNMLDDIDNQLMANTVVILKTYVSVVEKALEEKLKETNKAIFGAVLTGISFIGGMNSKSAFGTIAALSGTGAGVSVAVDSLNKISNYDELIKNVLQLCNDANNGVIASVSNKSDIFTEFENTVKQLKETLANAENATKGKDIASQTKNYLDDKISNIKNEYNLSKSLIDIKNEYDFTDEDFIRLSFLCNNHKAISMSNFKQNEEYKKELNSLFSKYNVGFIQRGNIITKLKKEPVH
jgi:hypothetical protein